ncbi:MAG: hypothetical protein JW876_02205 [Candidatus Krumholzibacteriota bacterium]|nr:hypothetical protein [Candidatus Krumholzibacteriota bacterium]
MHLGNRHNGVFLGLVLLYGLALGVFTIDYNSVFIDEAFHIEIGNQFLRGEPCSGCPFATGSVTLHPVLSALADRLGGLHAARGLNILLGLALTVVVYLTTRLLLGDGFGVIAAALFMFAGQTLYLMKLATYDMLAAFFLGLAFLAVVAAERVDTERLRAAALAAGAAALVIAAAVKYVVPVFVPAFLAWVWFRNGTRRTLLWFVLPAAALGAWFLFAVPYPPLRNMYGHIQTVRSLTQVPVGVLADWAFRWVAFAFLLAVFGCFRAKHGQTAILLAAMSAPIILLHLVTGSEQSVNKNMIFALVFLSPAAALGVDHIGTLFSMRSGVRAVRVFFSAAVLVIAWAYGFYNMRWLERQYPDVTPLIEFFEENGYDGMTVAMNGWDGVIYTYVFGERYPRATFVQLENALAAAGIDGDGAGAGPATDFIVCEDLYYGSFCPCTGYREYIERNYVLLEDFRIEHSWGVTDARIYGRI